MEFLLAKTKACDTQGLKLSVQSYEIDFSWAEVVPSLTAFGQDSQSGETHEGVVGTTSVFMDKHE